MEEALKLLLISAILLGFWVAVQLGFSRTGHAGSNRLLMVFVVLHILPPLNVYSQMAFGTMDWCWLLATHLPWLHGPFLYLFLRSLQGHTCSVRLAALHSLPFFLTLLIRMGPNSPPGALLASALFLQMGAYLLASGFLLVHGRQRLMENLQGQKRTCYLWLCYLLVGLALLSALDVFFISRFIWFTPVNTVAWQWGVAVAAMYIQGMAFFSLCNPKVFFNDVLDLGRRVISTSPLPEPEKKYRELSPTSADSLSQSLDALMHKERLYENNDLSLGQLADAMSLSTHQLSELLNTHRGQTFYDYVNQYRLQAAIALLEDPKCALPILDIAFESGFNNKNTFYRFFKAQTGLTPSAYRRQGSKVAVGA